MLIPFIVKLSVLGYFPLYSLCGITFKYRVNCLYKLLTIELKIKFYT